MPGSDEKDLQLQQPPDVQAAALEPTRSHDGAADLRINDTSDNAGHTARSLAEKEDDKIEQVQERRADSSSDDNDGEGDREERQRNLALTKSYATDNSAATSAIGAQDLEHEKSWFAKLNPLRWGKVPPIPDEPRVSREYSAGFFSLLFFSWMAPLMTVRSIL